MRCSWHGGRGGIQAVSLQEVLVVIAVIGILAAVGIPSLAGVWGHSARKVAERNLNKLNAALNTYRQASYAFTLAAESDTSDELAILRSLQYRDTMVSGSPFLSPFMNVEATSATDTFRACWNGEVFVLCVPGEEGWGIDLLEMGDTTTAVVYNGGYKPLGAP